MKRIALLVLAWCALPVSAQAVDYTCIAPAGVALMSNAVPNDNAAPTSCRLLMNGAQVASGPVVQSSTLPVAMVSNCQPTRAAYNPGAVGSVACYLGTGNLVPGTYTFVWYSSNVNNGVVQETGPSPPMVIQVVTAFTTAPAVLAKPIPR